MDIIATIHERLKGLFPDLLGVRLLEAAPERVTASLLVRAEAMHDGRRAARGAVMAFADTLGAVATVLNLAPGAPHHHAGIEDQLYQRSSRPRGGQGRMHALPPWTAAVHASVAG